MANKKKDMLKKVIQKVDLDKPTLNFTASVMNEIKAEAEDEVVVNPALNSLLKRNGIEKPSADFTRRIMAQVAALDLKTTSKPIIHKNSWYIITTSAVLFAFALSVPQQTSTAPQILTPYLINIGNTLNAIFTSVNAVPSLYLVTFMSTSMLLVIDYLIKIKDQHREKNRRLF